MDIVGSNKCSFLFPLWRFYSHFVDFMLQEHKINTNLGSVGSLEQILKASAPSFQSFGPKDSSRLTLQEDYVF